MKKVLLLLLVIVFLPVQAVHSQLIIGAPILETLATKAGIDQVIYYAQSLEQMVISVQNAIATAQHLYNQVEMAQRNLSRIGEISSFSDFFDWYNRQLYLERRSAETFDKMSITIGKKDYRLTDIDGMAYGMQDTFVDYWDREFTPEQRREMWLGLGMTPANYAYVQTWKQKEKELARKFLTSPAIKNNEYMQDMIRNNSILKRLAGDADMPLEDKMGEKEIAAINAEMSVHNNKILHDIGMSLAEIQEWLATERKLNEEIYFEPPAVSESFDKVYFRPLR